MYFKSNVTIVSYFLAWSLRNWSINTLSFQHMIYCHISGIYRLLYTLYFMHYATSCRFRKLHLCRQAVPSFVYIISPLPPFVYIISPLLSCKPRTCHINTASILIKRTFTHTQTQPDTHSISPLLQIKCRNLLCVFFDAELFHARFRENSSEEFWRKRYNNVNGNIKTNKQLQY